MNKMLTIIAMSSLLASPAWGSVREATFGSSADRNAAQTSMYAGATYRVSLDRRSTEPRERASLKLAGMSHVPGSSEIRFGDGLELTGGQTGRPALHLAGQDIGQFKTKAEMSGTTVALVVGGVLIAAAVAALVIADNIRDRERCEDDSEKC